MNSRSVLVAGNHRDVDDDGGYARVTGGRQIRMRLCWRSVPFDSLVNIEDVVLYASVVVMISFANCSSEGVRGLPNINSVHGLDVLTSLVLWVSIMLDMHRHPFLGKFLLYGNITCP